MIFKYFADLVVASLGLEGNAASALNFFIYDTLKILTILFSIILIVGYLRTYISNERIRNYLEKKHNFLGYVLAAVLGIISPFCSCSTIPLFLGFVAAGIPFGMTVTFLFVSPLVNEAAIVVFLGTLGWKATLAYVLGGASVGIAGGYALSKLGMGKYVKKFDLPSKMEDNNGDSGPNRKERFKQAYEEAKEVLKLVLPYVLIGIGIGALIHGFLPEKIITNYLSGSLGVPAAVLIGVPIYTNIMGVIPVAESLVMKGLPLGTALAFIMSVSALSLPQFIILKKVMKKELIVSYAFVLSLGILLLGLLFNALL